MKTPEGKVAEQIAMLAENHWFNPAVFGRYLANQPYYTIDRVMEMVAYIIKQTHIRHHNETENGYSSEGLILADELYHAILQVQEMNEFKNLKLPK